MHPPRPPKKITFFVLKIIDNIKLILILNVHLKIKLNNCTMLYLCIIRMTLKNIGVNRLGVLTGLI